MLARDRCGIKPLYYAELPAGGLVFASELTAVLAHGGVDRALGAEGLASYFFSDYVHPPYTITRAVKKLPPGHTLVWERGQLQTPRPFWQVPTAGASPAENDAALGERLWQGIERAVEAQLIADVPVGIFLSGGIDSSTVAAAAARRAGQRMTAFSIGFEDATFDESRYARMVAEKLGVEHVTETLREENLLDVVDLALDKLDEPLADPSYLPTFLLSRLAARHVKVVIGGDGGDELWGGYPTYRAHKLAAIWAAIPALGAERGGRAAGPQAADRRSLPEPRVEAAPVHRALGRRSRRAPPALDVQRRPAGARRRGAGRARAAPGHALARACPGGDDDWLNQILALDFTTYMSGSVLTKVDRASMAHGLEVRPPLLDDALVDFAFSLPGKRKLPGKQSKYLLKRAVRGQIPDEVIDRPKKGFGIPLAAWLRGPLAARLDAVVAESPLWELGLCDQKVFAAWHAEHRERKRDRSKPLWALYVLDRWLRRAQS